MDVIITHHNADLDAMASLVAASKLYPEAVILRGRALSQAVRRYRALHKDHFEMTPYSEIDPEQVERLIVVDVRDGRRLREYEPIIARRPHTVIYDHHPASAHDLEADEAVIEPVGACATLLCERLAEEGVALTAAEATLLMLGIYADTGQLTYSSTMPRDVDMAAWLLRRGANLRMVTRYLQQQFTQEQRQLLVALLGQVEELSVDAVEVAVAQASFGEYVSGASAVVERVMQLGGHDALFAVIDFDQDRRVQIIGRSRVPYVDVGQLLGQMGGGGHPGAGAATFKKRSLSEVRQQLDGLLCGQDFLPVRVGEVMTAPAQMVEHDVTLAELERRLQRAAISGMPVLRDGELAGVVSLRDLRKAKKGGNLELPISSHMSHEVLTISPQEPLEDALEMLTEADVGRLPVVDEAGRVVGIVSRSDLIRRFYRRHNAIDWLDEMDEPRDEASAAGGRAGEEG